MLDKVQKMNDPGFCVTMIFPGEAHTEATVDINDRQVGLVAVVDLIRGTLFDGIKAIGDVDFSGLQASVIVDVGNGSDADGCIKHVVQKHLYIPVARFAGQWTSCIQGIDVAAWTGSTIEE